MEKVDRICHLIKIVIISTLVISPVSAQQSRLLLQGATIIDGVSDTPLRGYSILIEDNLIKEVLQPGESVSGNVEVIDLDGKYIIPGLIDSHVHWLDWMGELYVNHGVTLCGWFDQSCKDQAYTQSDLPRTSTTIS